MDLLYVRYNCAKFHNCKMCVKDVRQWRAFLPRPIPEKAHPENVLRWNVVPLHKASTFRFWLWNLYTVWWCWCRLSTETFSCEYIYDVFRGRSSTNFKFLLIQLEMVWGWYTRACYSQKSTLYLNKLNSLDFSMFFYFWVR